MTSTTGFLKPYIIPYSQLEHPALKTHLDSLTAPLLKVLSSERYTFQFLIVENPAMNAFALPGGTIILHSGLIEHAERPEQILGVIAHEISHVTFQHATCRLIEQSGLAQLFQAFVGDLAGLGTVLATQSSTLLHMKFSREDESEADEAGARLLHRTGIDPRGMQEFFEILDKQQPSEGLPKALQWWRTHPDTQERIQNLTSV